jgi:hypothetical protein
LLLMRTANLVASIALLICSAVMLICNPFTWALAAVAAGVAVTAIANICTSEVRR